jgi:hypothetical protein
MLSQIASSVAETTVAVFVQAVISPANPITNAVRIVSVLLSRITQRVIARVPALLGNKAQK